jgi:hypothetical protein
MTTTTPSQVIEALKSRGITANEVPEHARNDLPVVNVWKGDGSGQRYPLTSLHWPDPDREKFNSFSWGDHFEHEAAPDTDADTLADLIAESTAGMEPR